MISGINLFNKVLESNLIENKKFLFKRPNYIKTFIGLGKKLSNQEKIRCELLENEDLTVPPIMILSITNDCNLNCVGCYACSQNRTKEDELTIEDIDRIIAEAIDLGVAIVMVAGGEPLVKKGILDVISKYKDILFVMFTNGLMINEGMSDKLKSIKNLVPVVSLEGNEVVTDLRRGSGVYEKVIKCLKNMDTKKMLFGTSITLTKENYASVMNEKYLNEIQDKGCIATFLIEYVPCNQDEELCLTEEQKADMIEKQEVFSKELSMLLIPLPGDEDKYSGCLAAGRGFLHVSSTGSLEACPFAPYSDTNLKITPLKKALKSKLLKEVRDNHHLLREGKGGCTLVSNKEWLESLI